MRLSDKIRELNERIRELNEKERELVRVRMDNIGLGDERKALQREIS